MDEPPPSLRPTFAADVHRHYADWNADALERLHRTARSNEERLLCRFRLYPMTEDEAYLDDIPEPSAGTARERALIAALWAYKTAIASPWRVPSYGKRSDRMLREARQLDPENPYVLLVQGQGQLYKPKMLGGNAEAALNTFRRFRERLAQSDGDADPSPWEADLWVWLAQRKVDPEAAAQERALLLAADPPACFRRFLQGPS